MSTDQFSVGEYHDPNETDSYFASLPEAMECATDRALKDTNAVLAVWDGSETVFIYTGGEVFARV